MTAVNGNQRIRMIRLWKEKIKGAFKMGALSGFIIQQLLLHPPSHQS